MKKIRKRLLATLLSVAMGAGVFQGPVYAQEVKEPETTVVETVETAEIETNKWDGNTTESVYENENYKVTYTLASYWETGYNANVKIENTGDSDIQNWHLSFNYTDEITNIWNAEISEHNENQYIIKNAVWNQDIAAGGCVEFGFSAQQAFTGFPESYELIGSSKEVKEDDFSILYQLDSDWGSGFTASVTVTNNTDAVLEDWTLEFDYAREITHIWNGVIESYENGHYVIKNAGYNANIAVGESISFGFNGVGGTSEDEPVSYLLYSYKLYNGESMELDTDEDSIVDGLETLWGLDYRKEDTDGDGLTDYEELYFTLTDPTKEDTNQNEISDALDDIDGDGIDNRTELDYGTDPLSADTDGDNLTDYDELYTYGTNALNADSDNDGLTDYDDIFLGFSPLLSDTDMDGILDKDEKLKQTVEEQFDKEEGKGVTKVSVSLEVSGNAQTNVGISNVYGMDVLSSNVVGLVGIPVEIRTEKEFEFAEISFYYDDNSLGEIREEDLSILWYDEVNDWYQILDNDCIVDVENNVVSYKTTHFSTYMLVDSRAWTDAWRENLDYKEVTEDKEEKCFDIIFVVDCSGSMIGASITKTKRAVTNFVWSMEEGDEAAIVKFTTEAKNVCDFTDNILTLQSGIKTLYADGGTDVNSGLVQALDMYKKRSNEKEKIVVLLCDGDVNYYKSTIDSYIKNNIHIYAINVAAATSHKTLEMMTEQTGGEYYYGENADSLESIFGVVRDVTINQIDITDTDGDGLYDIFETVGIRLSNGRVIKTDPKKEDTDGDGLSDFQETGIIYNINNNYIGSNVLARTKYFKLKSDPTKADTDDDGIIDSKDEHIWKAESLWVAELSNVYSNAEYLKIKVTENTFTVGGNQGWWKEGENPTLNYWDFATDKEHRIRKTGCGLIAVSDLELYLTQQNSGYSSPIQNIAYDKNTGVIEKSDYIDYVNLNADLGYEFGGGILYYFTGLMPDNMEMGLERYLKLNNHQYTDVKWAPYSMNGKEDEKELVLDEIETMLKNDLPVVFAYYTGDETKINLYASERCAIEKDINKKEGNTTTEDHYMTIIGLYKYLDENSNEYEYILKVTSWGKIYYIRYDEYIEKLGYLSNILRIQ